MLWFSDQKGLATGLAVAGFGAAKAIASPVIQWMLKGLGDGGIYKMFFILAAVYFVMMLLGSLMLKKPDGWHEPQNKQEKIPTLTVLKTRPIRNYIAIWLMFYINITCGLALLSQEKMILSCIGLAGFVGIISTLSAIFNAGGRIVFSAWADRLRDRNTIYKIIFSLSVVLTALVVVTGGIERGSGNLVLSALVLVLIMAINAGYGGGFSNVAALLSDHYGMSNISTIHGITLSAWAFAGLSGNQLAAWIVNHVGEFVTVNQKAVNPIGYQVVLCVVLLLFILALLLSCFLVDKTEK